MNIARSLSSILWMKQLAIRLGCKQPQPSRWLSRKRARRQESPHLNPLPQAGEEANEKSNYQYLNRYASFALTR